MKKFLLIPLLLILPLLADAQFQYTSMGIDHSSFYSTRIFNPTTGGVVWNERHYNYSYGVYMDSYIAYKMSVSLGFNYTRVGYKTSNSSDAATLASVGGGSYFNYTGKRHYWEIPLKTRFFLTRSLDSGIHLTLGYAYAYQFGNSSEIRVYSNGGGQIYNDKGSVGQSLYTSNHAFLAGIGMEMRVGDMLVNIVPEARYYFVNELKDSNSTSTFVTMGINLRIGGIMH